MPRSQRHLALSDESLSTSEPTGGFALMRLRVKQYFFYWLRWYVSGRTFEWFCASNMLGQGLLVFFYPIALEKSAFKYLAIDGRVLTLLFVTFGVARFAALFVNGRSAEFGPRVRIAGCLVGAFVWAQMTIALVLLSLETGYPSAGIPNWGLITAWELAAAYQAGTDVRRTR